ncbi:TorD/DmsD family molecular chaperone [Natrarchaeobaculum sulfurireducens]|uniref:Oxidoreductase component of anaerobic dehydrogenases n=1 Tax=Natrarchaeobaculum sulfurireducens TaxID=2044521 RepID=A0A346PRT0_9EURY|nr:molecular chaperone TorD family protein [Natrarchaeobaculum sulfurireducens]AXR82225.1 Putative oxidoreductase component of anaerobic dehydrogenases [Natrarchaeobaculum sulfurireducens]
MSTSALSPTDEQDRRALAGGYAVLAECWRQPTETLLEDVAVETLADVDPAVRDADIESLRVEHARLFVGPEEPKCPPYESVYRDSRDSVLGPTTRAVVKWYQTYGLGLDPDWPDLPDHVATELEFAAYLLEHEDVETCEQFLDEHPRQWMTAFLEGVRRETREPYYRALAELTAAAIEQ